MADFVRVASRSEIPAGEARAFDVGGRQVAVFHTGDGFHAIDNVCAHQGGPLAEGEMDGRIVTCPWHGWTYDVSTGVSPDDADCSVERFEVKIEGEDVLIAV